MELVTGLRDARTGSFSNLRVKSACCSLLNLAYGSEMIVTGIYMTGALEERRHGSQRIQARSVDEHCSSIAMFMSLSMIAVLASTLDEPINIELASCDI